MSKPTVAIFAGSKLPHDAEIVAAVEALGSALARAGVAINYGGGVTGVMGKVALAAVAAGGDVTAIDIDRYADQAQIDGIPLRFERDENARFTALSTHNNPIALIMLPGGPGAAREAMAALEHAVYDGGAPVILLKVGGYLDGLKNYFDHSIEQGLIAECHRDKMKLLTVDEIIRFVTAPKALISPQPTAHKP